MTVPVSLPAAEWRLECIGVDNCVEWHTSTGEFTGNLTPGYAAVRGDTRVLRFAPRYLLAINGNTADPPAGMATDAIRVDVSGKWRGYRLGGARAPQALAAGANVERVLDGRSCAALRLFDCPVVLLRTEERFEVWVQASYTKSFEMAIHAAARQVQ